MSSHVRIDDSSYTIMSGRDVHNLAWTLVTDPMNTNHGSHSKDRNYIPLLMMCLNLPPWIRGLPGFVVLAGMIPPDYSDTQPYLKIIADQFDAMKDGLPVYDGHERKEVCSI